MKPRSFILGISVLLAFLGCKPEGANTDAALISISVSSITDTQANLLVTHNGANNDAYYVVCHRVDRTDYTDAQLMDIAQEELSSGAAVLRGKKRIVTIDGLVSGGVYAALAVFVDETGAVRRTAASARVNFTAGVAHPLKLSFISRTKTSIEVRVECEEDEGWFIFATTDLRTDDQTLIQKELLDPDAGLITRYGTKDLVLEQLHPGWCYKVITFPADESGRYLRYDQIVQRTDWDPVKTEWDITYEGMTIYEDEELPSPLFSLHLPKTDTVVVSLFNLSALDDKFTLKYWMEAMVDRMGNWYTCDYKTFQPAPPRVGDWALLVVETEGVSYNLTGRYYLSETIHVQYDKAVESYLRWLGDWAVGDKDHTYHITIGQKDINSSYSVVGWENYMDEVVFYYDTVSGDMDIHSYLYDDDFTFYEGDHGELVFTALSYVEAENAYYPIPGGRKIATAQWEDSDKAVIVACDVSISKDFVAHPCYIQFIGYVDGDDDHYYFYTDPEEEPRLPMTMVREKAAAYADKGFTLNNGGAGSLSHSVLLSRKSSGRIRQ